MSTIWVECAIDCHHKVCQHNMKLKSQKRLTSAFLGSFYPSCRTKLTLTKRMAIQLSRLQLHIPSRCRLMSSAKANQLNWMPSHSNRSTQTWNGMHLLDMEWASPELYHFWITHLCGRWMQESPSFQSSLILNVGLQHLYICIISNTVYAIKLEQHDLVLQKSPSMFLVVQTWRLNILGIFGQAVGPQCRTVGLVCGGKACCRQLLGPGNIAISETLGETLYICSLPLGDINRTKLSNSSCSHFFVLVKHWNLAHYDSNQLICYQGWSFQISCTLSASPLDA